MFDILHLFSPPHYRYNPYTINPIMKHPFYLVPVYLLTKMGLTVLYILRELRYGFPNRNKIDGPSPYMPITGTGSMHRAADLPSHRYEFNAAAIDNTIYVAGGIFQPSVWLPTSAFECYSVKKDTWKTLPNMPHVAHHPGVAADNAHIYVIGGCGIRITPLAYSWRYKPKTGKWERLADMPTKRGALGLTRINKTLYAVGGADNGKKFSRLEAYDIDSNTWSRLPDMPTPREHLTSTTVGGKLHVLGGYNTDRFGALTTHEIYDPKTQSWQVAPPLPMRLCGFTAVGLNTSIYVFGGEQGWAVSRYVFEYDTVKKEWKRHADLEEPRYASSAVAVEKRIHIIGGNIRMFSDDFSRRHDVFIP